MKTSVNQVREAEGSASRFSKKQKNDLLFLGAILLLVAIGILALLLFRTEGSTVVVTVDGELWGEYSLEKDRSVEIRTPNGYNLLIISNGYAYVQTASCPDGICSSHRPIRYTGESIICLPNKVVVEVRSQENQTQPDIVV